MLSRTYARCKLNVGFSANMLECMLQIAASGESDEEIEKKETRQRRSWWEIRAGINPGRSSKARRCMCEYVYVSYS